MLGKSQTIGAFTFCRLPQIYRIIATILSLILPMNLAGNGKCAKNWNLRDGGTGAQQFGGLEIADVPDDTNLSFHLSGMITDHRRNLGPVGKIETLPILQICPRPSQTIGDIYDFEFSLVGKIWDSREAVKSPIVWDFPDMWDQG